MNQLVELSTSELDLVSGGRRGNDNRQYSIGSYNGNNNEVVIKGGNYSGKEGANGNTVNIGNGNGINL